MRYLENHLINIAKAIRERAVDRTLIVIVAGCGRLDEKDEEEELLSVGEEEVDGDEDGDEDGHGDEDGDEDDESDEDEHEHGDDEDGDDVIIATHKQMFSSLL